MGLAEDIKKEVFTYKNLVHAISGMTGGVIAISTFYPLNIIRIKLQVEEKLKSQSVLSVAKLIADEEGVGGLYKGWWSSVVSLGASNFVYFYTCTWFCLSFVFLLGVLLTFVFYLYVGSYKITRSKLCTSRSSQKARKLLTPSPTC